MAKKVLIADDSQTIRQAFEMTFSGDSGVEIFGAGDVASALSTAKEQMPDLIIADSNLGDATGYDLCKQIKADGQVSGIPVWIMTGPAERMDDDLYAECGADGHVRKPFDTQRMVDKVSAMAAPPDEEKSRPSYPPAAAKPAVLPPAAAKPPPPAHAVETEKRPRQATLMGGPVAPPVKPQPPEVPLAAPLKPPPPKAEPEVVQTETVAELAQMGSDLEPKKPAASPGAVEVEAADVATPAAAAALAGLTDEQREAVMVLIREIVEKTVWEVVPDMAESIIREEIARLLKD
ncbi:MAG: response regulator [Deltaproteobacteria bacterium]|nr:response regulator [Deltaproteobacteria bacterium]